MIRRIKRVDLDSCYDAEHLRPHLRRVRSLPTFLT